MGVAFVVLCRCSLSFKSTNFRKGQEKVQYNEYVMSLKSNSSHYNILPVRHLYQNVTSDEFLIKLFLLLPPHKQHIPRQGKS